MIAFKDEDIPRIIVLAVIATVIVIIAIIVIIVILAIIEILVNTTVAMSLISAFVVRPGKHPYARYLLKA